MGYQLNKKQIEKKLSEITRVKSWFEPSVRIYELERLREQTSPMMPELLKKIDAEIKICEQKMGIGG